MKEKWPSNFLKITGAGIPGVLLSVLIELPLFYFSLANRFLLIQIFPRTGFLLGCIFLILFLSLTLWALKSLPIEKRGQVLVKDGPYKFIRHPSYSAKIFFLLPGLAIIFRVWLPLLSIPILLVIWNEEVKEEEKLMKKIFGETFDDYCRKTGKFFPFFSPIALFKKTTK